MTMVEQISMEEAMDLYGHVCQHYVARADDETVLGLCAVTRKDDRLWAYVDVTEGLSRAHSIAAVKAMREGLEMLADDVYVTCNAGVHPNAVRLLNLLGFHATGEARNGMEIYLWRN